MQQLSNAIYHTLLTVFGLYLISTHYDILLAISGIILCLTSIITIISLYADTSK